MLRNLIASNSLSLDLHPFGTDKGTIHSYIEELYTPIFESGETFGVVYEIGVWRGASLVAWKLLLPHAKVVGYDIERRELHPVALSLLENKQISINYDDAYSDSVIDQVHDEIDILIDDGPHTIESQINSLKWLNRLSTRGTLVIEDIEGGIVGVRKILKHVPKELQSRCLYFTTFHRTGRFDDTILVISKSNLILESLTKNAAKNYFWGMRNKLAWKFFRLIYKILVRINIKHYR